MSAHLISQDLAHIWHPCSQMKDYEQLPPLPIARARGSHLYLNDGKRIIDAIASWWCKSLGHNHPVLKQSLLTQLEKFEHVILANTTNETIVALADELANLMPALNKIFFANDGSAAVEVALKMSLHAHALQGESQRHLMVALGNGYHGETIGALSVSDLGIYRQAYTPLLFSTPLLTPLPYVNSITDPLWHNCESYWTTLLQQLQPLANNISAIIVEPIVQGAAGMLIYSQDLLRRLRHWTEQHGIYLIADEIMTGFWRTGKQLACEHAAIQPDFLCLGKGITSGWLPMSPVLTTAAIYDLFYDDYHKQKSFLHSHTYCGNALAASVALATLQVMRQENIGQQVARIEPLLLHHMLDIAEITGKLKNVRSLGAIVAADLCCDTNQRMGFKVYQNAIELGALLRPIGNTIYWLPPLNIDDATMLELKDITLRAITAAF